MRSGCSNTRLDGKSRRFERQRAGRDANIECSRNGQHSDQTWLPLFKQTFPQRAQGMSDQQILALRGDPGTSAAMTLQYARQNAPVLQQASQPPTAANLALAHRYGPQGAVSLLQASPDAPASQVLGPAAAAANPTLQGQTVGRSSGPR